MTDRSDFDQAETSPSWWLLVDGQTVGPHSQAYIASMIDDNSVTDETLACLVGESRWQSLKEWPQFNELISVGPAHNVNPYAAPAADIDFMSPSEKRPLPLMVNLIWGYCLIVCPLLTLLTIVMTVAFDGFNTATQAAFDPFIASVGDVLESFVLTAVLIIGAVQLVNLQKTWLWLLVCGMCVSLTQAVLVIVAGAITVVVFMGVPEEIATTEETITNAQAIGWLALFCVGLPSHWLHWCLKSGRWSGCTEMQQNFLGSTSRPAGKESSHDPSKILFCKRYPPTGAVHRRGNRQAG